MHGTPSSSSFSFSFPSPRNTYKRCQYYSHAVTSLGRTAYRRGSHQLGKSLQKAVPYVGPSSCIRYHCLQWNPRPGNWEFGFHSLGLGDGRTGGRVVRCLLVEGGALRLGYLYANATCWDMERFHCRSAVDGTRCVIVGRKQERDESCGLIHLLYYPLLLAL